jgi:hypothetical protein
LLHPDNGPLFSADKSGIVEIKIAGALFQSQHSSDLRTQKSREFDASKLFEKLDQLQPAEAHWTFS